MRGSVERMVMAESALLKNARTRYTAITAAEDQVRSLLNDVGKPAQFPEAVCTAGGRRYG